MCLPFPGFTFTDRMVTYNAQFKVNGWLLRMVVEVKLKGVTVTGNFWKIERGFVITGPGLSASNEHQTNNPPGYANCKDDFSRDWNRDLIAVTDSVIAGKNKN